MSTHRPCDALDQLEGFERLQSRTCARHGPVVVKRMHGRSAEAEMNGRRVAAAISGIQVPEVLGQLVDGDVVYLELATANRCRETSVDDLLGVAHALATSTAEIGRPIDMVGVIRERLDWITSGSTSMSALAKAVSADLPTRWIEPESFCHGDLHPSNVIPTRTGIAVIDWEHSAWLSAAWDITKMAIVADLPVRSWEELARQAGMNRRQLQILVRLHVVEGLYYAVEQENRDHELWRERARRVGLARPRAISNQ